MQSAGVDPAYYTMVYSLLGVTCLATGRALGLRPEVDEAADTGQYISLAGRGALQEE